MSEPSPAVPLSRSILVIEDEPTIAEAVALRLRSEGFAVDIASDGPAGVEACDRLAPDLVVLDLMLPGLDGLEVCRRIQRARAVPVLMLTARDTEDDLVVGLATGADDYLTKPFSGRELVARVRALLRRVERAAEVTDDAQLVLGDVDLDVAGRRVSRGDDPIHLTPTEFDLLAFLWPPGFLFDSNGAVLPTKRIVCMNRVATSSQPNDTHVAIALRVGA